MSAPNDECWDMFGDDDESEEEVNEFVESHQGDLSKACEAGALHLTQQFLRNNAQVSLKQRYVCVGQEQKCWSHALEKRAITIASNKHPDNGSSDGLVCDAAVVTSLSDPSVPSGQTKCQEARCMKRCIVPGGILLCIDSCLDACIKLLDIRVWDVANAESIFTGSEFILAAVVKRPCPINTMSCRWKPSSPSLLEYERSILRDATVTRSAHEILTKARLTENGLQQAATALKTHGYCVIRSLLDPDQSLQWGAAVVRDFDSAATIILERDGVDLRNPQQSRNNPHNYREMAMREDLRVDLRDGPNLRKLRDIEHNHYDKWNVEATNTEGPLVTTSAGSPHSFMRFQSDVLEVTKRVMNPNGQKLYKGNFGRYNFGGSGPDGSQQALRIGPMGGILSLPGSADQAIHADTAHLFEHMDCLPAHYVNAFALGANVGGVYDSDGSFTGSTSVGGTAFVHGSHQLSMTAAWNDDNKTSTSLMGGTGHEDMLRNVVRPSLSVGDIAIFDCRVLHFGLANTSEDVERPLLYVNMSHSWFHDPKNWDDRKRIFD